ncbi:hypothetical protein [Helicobacter pylori]|uniref:hypothetical protein n=1 Tax=Helicobacter pylori TaxID=210 RepID=UPI000AB8C476|nr:hypothetical protein [Helicobacter pylori]
MNYPNLPNSALEISEQPQVKEIPNDTIISKVFNGSVCRYKLYKRIKQHHNKE